MRFTHLSSAVSAVVAALLAVNVLAADPGFPAPTGDANVLPAGAKLDRVFEGGCMLSEGVAAGHDGMIYFSDITFTKFCKDPSGKFMQAGNIWQLNPKSNEAKIWRSPSGMSNGIKFDREGNMLAALGADYGGRMLIRTDMKSGRSIILAGMFEGKEFNALNDISLDEKGRIYFTDPRYLGHEPVRADGFAAYRLDPDGTLARVATDCGKCNGILVTPDQKRVFIVSNDNGFLEFQNLKEGEKSLSGPHLLQVYDLGADGKLTNRKVFKDYSKDRNPACSGPDGLAADADGNIYVAERCEHRPGIVVYSPDGKELAYISTGKEMPTNVGFGRGEDANLLWVTSGKSLYKIRMAKKGYQLP